METVPFCRAIDEMLLEGGAEDFSQLAILLPYTFRAMPLLVSMSSHNDHFGEAFTGALLSQHLRLDGTEGVLGDLEVAEWGRVGSTHWLTPHKEVDSLGDGQAFPTA